ncbi:MAG: alkaline phosphatase family protein [Gemmatimonadaceae bacterium]|nr:alkaline phosphatase family protein [Gemmatimonadaceae bacterium]
MPAPVRALGPAILAAALALPTVGAAQPARRVIVVSYDAFNESRVPGLLGQAVPTFRAMSREAACTDGARPMFPSLTAASHAALWTGAWGNVNGIAGNRLMLPMADSVTTMTTGDGFRFEHLNAEPAWLALSRQGRRVIGLHVTQAPGVPGYPWRGDREAMRAEAARELAKPGTWVLNGYNEKVVEARVLTEADLPARPAAGWAALRRLPRDARPLHELAWTIDRDSVFALVVATGPTANRLYVAARSRDLSQAVEVRAIEAAPARAAEPLARHFSAPLRLTTDAGRVFARWRLFALSADGTRFTLFQPELNVVSANRPEVADAHDAAVEGFYGNGAGYLWMRGRLGPTYRTGGDGTAERRYLETVELSVLGSLKGAEWAWKHGRPEALFTYLSVGDGVDHDVWGDALPAPPVAADTTRVRRAREVRAAVWALADRHLAQLRFLARTQPGTAILVSGDHGMRAVWKRLRVNVALANAGLVVFDTTLTRRGTRIDTIVRVNTARSQVVSPAGYWINANTTVRGGPVPVDSAEAVLARAAEVLRALRDVDDAPVVTGIRRPTSDDTLGLGGPAGGDLYWDLREGWGASADTRGVALGVDRDPSGAHGFTSIDRDMQTAFCAWGTGIPAGRHGPGRIIDVVPTAAEWLKAAPPRDARGTSQLRTFLGATEP